MTADEAAGQVRYALSPGPILTPWELSLTEPWLRHTAPTCCTRVLEESNANGFCGFVHPFLWPLPRGRFMAATPTREEIDEEKAALRARGRDRRAEIHARDGAEAARAMRDRFLARVPLAAGAVVAGYWPFGSEMDPMPLLEALHNRGHGLALPVVERRGAPLIFRRWKPGDEMSAHRFGMSEPLATRPRVDPDIIVAPLLCFDARGNRLGYGGGFYDRTLIVQRKIKPTLAVGVAFAAQRVERIPTDIHDQKLDWIVTETEALRAKTDAKRNWWWPW